MDFLEHVNEIWTVARERDVDVGVAFDMFRADISNGESKPFNTADALPETDFAALKADWDAMTKDEQREAAAQWHAFSRKNYAAICEAFAVGPEMVQIVVDEWLGKNYAD